jgi:hypothetical protein
MFPKSKRKIQQKYNLTEMVKKEDINYTLKKIVHIIFKGESVRDWMNWGTYGKSGKEPGRWVTLKNMSDEHIQAILDTQHQITKFYRKEFLGELKLRKKNPALSLKETV